MSLTSIPSNPPCVVSKSYALMAFHIACIVDGGKGIIFGIDHWNAYVVCPGGRGWGVYADLKEVSVAGAHW